MVDDDNHNAGVTGKKKQKILATTFDPTNKKKDARMDG